MIVRKFKNINTYVTGRAHEKKSTPCQDRTKYVLENGTHVLSLCDGAGSRNYSQFGAEIVTQAACDYFSKNFDNVYSIICNNLSSPEEKETLINDFLNYMVKKTDEFLSDHKEITNNELLCTLEFVAIKKDKYIAGHCGDGVIGKLVDSDGREMIEVLSNPDNGEASNITYFINDKNGSKHLRLYHGSLLGIEGFILMSDGPEEALFNKVNGLNPNTNIFFNAVRDCSSKEGKELITKVLSEKIAGISYDDLSINVMVYAEIDLDKDMTDEECEDYFGEVYENQIVIESGYYASIDLCRKEEGRLLKGKQVIDEINKLRGQCV